MSRTRHHHHRQFSPSKSPGWHHHIYFERPSRAQARRLERLATRTTDLDDVDRVEWPLASKPHIYYW